MRQTSKRFTGCPAPLPSASQFTRVTDGTRSETLTIVQNASSTFCNPIDEQILVVLSAETIAEPSNDCSLPSVNQPKIHLLPSGLKQSKNQSKSSPKPKSKRPKSKIGNRCDRWRMMQNEKWLAVQERIRKLQQKGEIYQGDELPPKKLTPHLINQIKRWMETLPKYILLMDDELTDQLTTQREHTIEQHAETLGDYVNNCEDWGNILGEVFPGLYKPRRKSTKSIMHYPDGSLEIIKRYRLRAYHGNSIFNSGDSNGTQTIAESKAAANRHKPHHTTPTRHPTIRPLPGLLRELATCAADAFGCEPTMRNVPS